MNLRLYDTKSREKRDFVPANPERVTMYVCGNGAIFAVPADRTAV